MNKIIPTIIGVYSLALGSALAATPYRITWDNNPNPNTVAGTYFPGTGETLPAGITQLNMSGLPTIGYPGGYGIPPSSYPGNQQVLENQFAWPGGSTYVITENAAGGLRGPFTYEAVFRLVPTNTSIGIRGLIYDNASSGNERGLNVVLADNGSGMFQVSYGIDALGGGGGLIGLTSGYVVETNRWYHLAVVHDNVGARIYLDSQLIASNSSPIGTRLVVGTDSSLEIGGDHFSQGRELAGFLDSWAISDLPLSPGGFAIPEPTTVALLGVGGLILAGRRRQRRPRKEP